MARPPSAAKLPTRKDDRVIIHFDYDCFYTSVVEASDPALKTQPLAIQQKQIIVTCNYEARKRGLHKLQLITEARRVCPEVIVVLGEDLTRFRDASKALYNYLRGCSWNEKVERLGFDEIWMDVTDIVQYNAQLLNPNNLKHSFFQLAKDDPTQGFTYDASQIAGHAYPTTASPSLDAQADQLACRLLVASHFAMHLRHLLEQHQGYTSTVGISTNRLLSKLVGNLHKPRGQTTLRPPYEAHPTTNLQDNVQPFMDYHDIGAVPWIGFKSAQKLREAVLHRPAEFSTGLVYGGSKEAVTVEMVRSMSGMGPELLERVLAGPGQPRGVGSKTWGLLHGIDSSEVAQAKNVPRQISIEDSYIRLDTMKQLTDELRRLSLRLVERMRIDLTEANGDQRPNTGLTKAALRSWIGRPHALRLTTRPRLPVGPDGTRPRTFKRISRTGSMPSWVFNLESSAEALAQRLVSESLMPLFRKLHPGKGGWNLSLVNVAATDMTDTGTDSKSAVGRNIQSMFEKQETVLHGLQTINEQGQPIAMRSDGFLPSADSGIIKEEMLQVPDTYQDKEGEQTSWHPSEMEQSVSLFNDNEEEDDEEQEEPDDDAPGGQGFECHTCGEMVPAFAQSAHERFHLDAG